MSSLRSALEVRIATGDPPSTVRVRNLQTTIQGPADAWGRTGKPQPISISVIVTLNQAFGSSASTDKVAPDTVHYGLLSKAILLTLTESAAQRTEPPTLEIVLYDIWRDLTGLDLNGHPIYTLPKDPFLNMSVIRSLEVTLHLPKASLLGTGVSLKKVALFRREDNKDVEWIRGRSLKIHDLRVPTLIGVNDNERTAKQVVVAGIEIDKYGDTQDIYHKIEEVAVKTMTESSYETLEALLKDMATKIAEFLRDNCHAPEDGSGWGVRIALEKPIAVVAADAACVELSANTSDLLSKQSS